MGFGLKTVPQLDVIRKPLSESEIENDFAKVLQKSWDEKEQLKVQLKTAFTDSKDEKVEIEALKIELQQEKILTADLEKKVAKMNSQLEKVISVMTEMKSS
jgi:hypothetical protein